MRGKRFVLRNKCFDEIYSKGSKIFSQPTKGNEQKISVDAVDGKRFNVSGGSLFFGRNGIPSLRSENG